MQEGGDQGPEVHHADHLLREGEGGEQAGRADQQESDENATVWKARRRRPLLSLL